MLDQAAGDKKRAREFSIHKLTLERVTKVIAAYAGWL
jgi:hypothetical protein